MNQEEDVQEAKAQVVDEKPKHNGQARPAAAPGSTASETFGGSALQTSSEISMTGDAAREKARVEARFIVAMNRPRNWRLVRERILEACRSPRFARDARYLKPIGDGVVGPSIRFAEEAMRHMGNLDVLAPLKSEDALKRTYTVSVTDLETNNSWSIDVPVEKTLERRSPRDGQVVRGERLNSYGKKVFLIEASGDDVLDKQNALISKAARGQILRAVPSYLIEEAMDECVKTQLLDDEKHLVTARTNIEKAYSNIGVTAEDLKTYLGHPMSEATAAEIGELRGVGNAIKDGQTTWKESLDHKLADRQASDRPSGASPQTAKEKVAAAAAKAAETNGAKAETKGEPAETPAAKAETPPVPPKSAPRSSDDDDAAAAERYFARQEAEKAKAK